MINPLVSKSKHAFALLAVSVMACGLTSCGYIHYSEKDRPGRVDVADPPPQTDEPERVKPADPGAMHLSLVGRGLIEAGGMWVDGDGEFALQLGGELTTSIGTSSELWRAKLGPWPIPDQMLGIAVGGLPYTSHDDGEARLYTEVFGGHGLANIGAGWTYQPAIDQHGSQLTLRLLELTYARWNWDFDHGWSLTAGLSVPFSGFYYVRSR